MHGLCSGRLRLAREAATASMASTIDVYSTAAPIGIDEAAEVMRFCLRFDGCGIAPVRAFRTEDGRGFGKIPGGNPPCGARLLHLLPRVDRVSGHGRRGGRRLPSPGSFGGGFGMLPPLWYSTSSPLIEAVPSNQSHTALLLSLVFGRRPQYLYGERRTRLNSSRRTDSAWPSQKAILIRPSRPLSARFFAFLS